MYEKISIVSPVYKAQALLQPLAERIAATLLPLGIDYELILVDDGSPDGAWERICWIARQDGRVKGLRLSRNFGQHAAIFAGLQQASGEWVVVMDCDLQDRPEEIPALLQRAQEGYEVVLARREERQDGLLKRLGSRLFYACFSYLTDMPQDAAVANFGVYHRRVVQALGQMGDAFPFLPAMVRWVGFRTATVPVQHDARPEGRSSYSLGRLWRLGLHTALSFSDKPLRLVVKGGLLMSAGAFAVALYYLYLALSGEIRVLGFSSLIISMWLLSGLIISVLGVLGLYIGRIFAQSKGRPVFIVAENTYETQASYVG